MRQRTRTSSFTAHSEGAMRLSRNNSSESRWFLCNRARMLGGTSRLAAGDHPSTHGEPDQIVIRHREIAKLSVLKIVSARRDHNPVDAKGSHSILGTRRIISPLSARFEKPDQSGDDREGTSIGSPTVTAPRQNSDHEPRPWSSWARA